VNKNLYLCLHGHFYQPPRENAWTGEIEQQPSASPFHDWNERIYQECYKPNTNAVIIDDHGNVLKRLNNYEYLNYNFGATVFAWMKKNHPNTFAKIIEADAASAQKHEGHGNAIAMAYNHMIMPLANYRDKITQIKWGMRDFEYHFGRSSESIWLPETACNYETIEALIEENVKYIILDPSQAKAVKAPGAEKWEDVSGSRINTRRAYRCYSRKNPSSYINIFFYNGALAKAIAFEDILFDSHRLIKRIKDAVDVTIPGAQLISAATDGETFGHHKAYSERTLAYLFDELLEKSGFKPVNYGEFLDLFPAEWSVTLNEGEAGEGTAWSCAHGVGRWQDDCGCNTGGEEGWTQEWRRPLREALNVLRDELAVIYEEQAGRYLNDPWDARNHYINVVIEPSWENIEKFFFFNSKKYLTREETDTCLKLLEMQKFAMLMFTSCAWFFSEISGIETVQVLEYAARAIELAQEVSDKDPEPGFTKMLAKAKSNTAKYKSGKEVFKEILKRNAGYMEEKLEY
jgi:alpha-amylase/alpha-mannosidase (GH57 family)